MGRKRQFAGCYFFIFTKSTAKCTLCDYQYEPKSGSDVHSKPLQDHLKRKHADEYQKAVEEKPSTSRGEKHGQIMEYFSTTDGDGASSHKVPRLHNVTFRASKEYIQELAVEAVTVNGLPLSVF